MNEMQKKGLKILSGIQADILLYFQTAISYFIDHFPSIFLFDVLLDLVTEVPMPSLSRFVVILFK